MLNPVMDAMLPQSEEVSFAPKTLLDGLFFDFSSYVIDADGKVGQNASETAPSDGVGGPEAEQKNEESPTDQEPKCIKFIHTNEIFSFTLPTSTMTGTEQETTKSTPELGPQEPGSAKVIVMDEVAQK